MEIAGRPQIRSKICAEILEVEKQQLEIAGLPFARHLSALEQIYIPDERL